MLSVAINFKEYISHFIQAKEHLLLNSVQTGKVSLQLKIQENKLKLF